MKKIRTSINEKWVDSDGILRMKVLEGSFIDLPSLLEDAKVNDELTEGKNHLFFMMRHPILRSLLKPANI